MATQQVLLQTTLEWQNGGLLKTQALETHSLNPFSGSSTHYLCYSGQVSNNNSTTLLAFFKMRPNAVFMK